MSVRLALSQRPIDATLTVTKAARLLGVHPNTVRSWSDQGRLRFYRINPRGDRRYRLGDLQRFLAAAERPAGERQAGERAEADRSGGGRSAGEPAPGPRLRSHVGLSDGAPYAAITMLRPAPVLPRPTSAPPLVGSGGEDRHRLDLRLLAELSSLAVSGRSIERSLERAVRLIRQGHRYDLVGIWELRGGELVPLAQDGRRIGRPVNMPADAGTVGRALAAGHAVRSTEHDTFSPPSVLAGARVEIVAPILVDGRPWGVLLAAAAVSDAASESELEFLESAVCQVGVVVYSARLLGEAARQLHRADALRRVSNDISSKLDLEQILAGLVDHAMVLFASDRAAVFLRKPDGKIVAEISRGLSDTYLASVRDFPTPSLPADAVAVRRPLYATHYAQASTDRALRAAIVQEGYDTICAGPMFAAGELLGLLIVYHDQPHEWSEDELQTMGALAAQASIAIKTAQNYAQMATWAAQLQSIQQLGARLNRLTSVAEIGLAIATELHQLIDYHNVRVYRLNGDDLIPVAMRGQVGEYVDETPEQLKVHVGEGITGWVALHMVAQNLPDAANDPRARTIPGTEEDLDESMVLAPMVFEDRVLGVVVLSKLGLNQFTDDDLRLLVIYASFAAQAMANADATERLRQQSATLERRVRSQRELLQITESILVTLQPRAVLDQIAERLGALVEYDNISIELYDQAAKRLRPLTAKGVNADEYLRDWQPGEVGVAGWVIEHNEPQLVPDELLDPRVLPFEVTGPVEGSLIVVPLRGREGVKGVLTLERLGREHRFQDDDFELVKLFAAHVSIALQNAEAHTAVEVRARSDDLTGLLNHGTFKEWLVRHVAGRDPFSLIMLDLDDFKAVNDALGHQAGDGFLRDVARAIVAAGRDTDQVFRYGGDEFTLILPSTHGDGARLVAERVRTAIRAISAPGSPWAEAGLEASCSIGIASYPDDGPNAESILLAADRACFVAKRNGQLAIATAAEGRSVAGEFSLTQPTPVDPPTVPS